MSSVPSLRQTHFQAHNTRPEDCHLQLQLGAMQVRGRLEEVGLERGDTAEGKRVSNDPNIIKRLPEAKLT
jgi:hypothetical protein